MTDRTVDVHLRLEIGDYLGNAAKVIAANRGMEKSMEDFGDRTNDTDKDTEELGKENRKLRNDLDATGKSANKAGNELGGMNRNTRDLKTTIERSRGELHGLLVELDRTGNMDLLPDIRKSRNSIRELERARDLLKDMNDLGGKNRNVFKDALSGFEGGRPISGAIRAITALPPPVSIPVGAGIATGIGGGANALGLGILGLAGVAGGVALAATTKEVQTAFKNMVGAAFVTLQQDARGFVQPLVDAAQIFSQEFDKIEPQIATTLNRLSGLVRPLAQGFAGFFDQLMPGLAAGLKGAEPVIRQLALELPHLGAAMGTMFALMGKGGKGAAESFTLLSDIVQMSMLTFGGFVLAGSKVVEMLESIAGTMQKMDSPVPGMNILQFTSPLIAGLMEANKKKGEDIKPDTAGIDALAASAEAAAGALNDLSHALDENFGKMMSLDEANLGFNQSLLDLRGSVKENGKAFDEFSAKGIANREALLGSVQAAEEVRDANIAMGMPIADANAKFLQQINQVKALAKALGLPIGQVQALIDKYVNLMRQPDIHKRIQIQIQQTGSMPGNMHGQVFFNAKGGYTPPGAPQIVGEEGPELLSFNRPTWITPMNNGGGRAAGMGNAGSVREVHIVIEGTGLLSGLRRELRIRGGDVQLALGTGG